MGRDSAALIEGTPLAGLRDDLVRAGFVLTGLRDLGIALRCELPKSGATTFVYLTRNLTFDLLKVEITSVLTTGLVFSHTVFNGHGSFSEPELAAICRTISNLTVALEELE